MVGDWWVTPVIPGPRRRRWRRPRAWALYERPALRAGLRKGECDSPLRRILPLPLTPTQILTLTLILPLPLIPPLRANVIRPYA